MAKPPEHIPVENLADKAYRGAARNPSLMPGRKTLLFAIAVLLLAAGLGIAVLTAPRGTALLGGSGEALVGGPFTLTDHRGKTVSEKAFHGRYMLVFFGYTFCPDVCPTELQVRRPGTLLSARARLVIPTRAW